MGVVKHGERPFRSGTGWFTARCWLNVAVFWGPSPLISTHEDRGLKLPKEVADNADNCHRWVVARSLRNLGELDLRTKVGDPMKRQGGVSLGR
jgi:hypothetical protein